MRNGLLALLRMYPFVIDMTSGTLKMCSHPYGFKCEFVPRVQGLTAEKLTQMF